MISLIALGLAVALLVLHFVDRRVSMGHVLAAFLAAALVSAGDLREPAGQACTTTTTTSTTTTTNSLGGTVTVTQTYPVETCTVHYTVNYEALIALIVSVAFAVLALVVYALERLGETAAGGWTA
jgi:hypothetical protein